MSIPASFWWAARLMSAALKTPSWLEQIRERYELPDGSDAPFAAWLAAAEMLDDWPQSFEQFLEVFQTVTKHRTTDTGLSRSFGLLLRDAAHLEHLGDSAPAEVLRAYLLQRYTRGHLTTKVCLFKEPKHRRLVERRPWLTQTEAAVRLGLRQGAVADLVQRGLLDGDVRPAGQRGRSVGVVSRRSVERLKRQLTTSLSAQQAATRLGIGRHRVFELIHANLLTGAVRTARGWLIPEPSVGQLESCYNRLPVLKRPQSVWLSLRQATRQFGSSGLKLVQLMEFVQSGRVRARRSSGSGDWRGLKVHHEDLQQARPEIREQQNLSRGYPLNRLCQELIPGRPLKDSVLRKWVRAGLLRAERRGRMRFVAPAEVARFRATYCLANEVCDMLRVTRSTLTRWEAAGKIAAIYSRRTHSGAGASVFLRTDVTKLLATRLGDTSVSA
jgi:hypothetical protein